MEVQQGKELNLENVLSLRKRMTEAEVQQEMIQIGKFLESKDINKNGPVVTATFAVEEVDGQVILDMEILVPMDKSIALEGEYKRKKVFHLVNAVYARHEGNPSLLQNTYNQMLEYVQENELQQITAAYNVNMVDLQQGQSMDEMIIDVYIGINPSRV